MDRRAQKHRSTLSVSRRSRHATPAADSAHKVGPDASTHVVFWILVAVLFCKSRSPAHRLGGHQRGHTTTNLFERQHVFLSLHDRRQGARQLMEHAKEQPVLQVREHAATEHSWKTHLLACCSCWLREAPSFLSSSCPTFLERRDRMVSHARTRMGSARRGLENVM